jgi:hypothetical protein
VQEENLARALHKSTLTVCYSDCERSHFVGSIESSDKLQMRLQQNRLRLVIEMEVVRFSMFTSGCASVFQSCSFLGTSKRKKSSGNGVLLTFQVNLFIHVWCISRRPEGSSGEKHKQQKVLFVSAGKQAQASLKKNANQLCRVRLCMS